MTASLLGEKYYVVEFEESPPLSTYLYSLVAGPFHMY
jgi:aminopeptidase N